MNDEKTVQVIAAEITAMNKRTQQLYKDVKVAVAKKDVAAARNLMAEAESIEKKTTELVKEMHDKIQPFMNDATVSHEMKNQVQGVINQLDAMLKKEGF